MSQLHPPPHALPSEFPASFPAESRLPFVKSRSWICPKNSRPRTYRIGFDHEDRPVRFELVGTLHERRVLVLAWRTVSGAWIGKYRCPSGYATVRLCRGEVAFIESVGKVALASERA